MDPGPSSRSSRRRLLRWGGAVALAGVGLARPRPGAAVALWKVSATVTVATLNVRSGPGTSYGIVGRLGAGATVSCLATAGQWFQIATSTLGGYVYSPYVTLVTPGSAWTFTRGSTARKTVSLTFDAGADSGHTGTILDTLAYYGVKTSFGLTGKWANANNALTARIVNEGHHLINHTLTHRSFTGFSSGAAALTPSERLEEVVTTALALKAITGVSGTPWFRPPYGDHDAGVLRDITAAGFWNNAMWTVDSLGWKGISRDEIVNRCLANHGNGYVYLFHVGSASQDSAALGRIIEGLGAKGYGFGTMAQVVA